MKITLQIDLEGEDLDLTEVKQDMMDPFQKMFFEDAIVGVIWDFYHTYGSSNGQALSERIKATGFRVKEVDHGS